MAEETDSNTLDAAIFGASASGMFGESEAESESQYDTEEVNEEEQQPQEVEKQQYTFKVRGEEVTQELTPEEFHAIAQKGMDYDRQMSKLDLDRKAILEDQQRLANERSQLLADAEAGRILKEVQMNKPHVYAKWFEALENDRVQSQMPTVSALQKEVGELNELANDEAVKDIPLFGKMATLINKLSTEITDLRSGRTSELSELEQKVSSLSQYKENLEATKQQNYVQAELNRFQTWANDNSLQVVPGSFEINAMKSLVNGGMDIIQAAQLAYKKHDTQPETNNIQGTTETREIRPAKLKTPKTAATVNSDRDLLDKVLYPTRKLMFK